MEKNYVLFDFDGVIADTEESNSHYLGLALKAFGVELTQEDKDQLIGTHDSALLYELLGRSPEKITMEQLLEKRKELGNTYENERIEPMDGLLDFITDLKKRGKKQEECIAIEDSSIGIKAAKAAGIEVIAYTGSGENQDVNQADYVLSVYESGSEWI